jgi:NDP-sugar pyrophosphorylase family protein
MPLPTTAMVLAAGLGTRLGPLSDLRAKPAMPVAGQPLIRRIVSWLAAGGVTDVVVNLHHRPASIAAVLGDGCDLGVRIRYSWEQPTLLGSAGGPRLALPLLGVETFFLVNGDTLSDVDLAALSARHEDAGARVTLAVVPNRDPLKYGGVRLDPRGAVTGFARRGAAAQGTSHFTGVQIVEASVFRALSPGRPEATIGGAYDALLATAPGTIVADVSNAGFLDIGTPDDYLAASRALSGPGNPGLAPDRSARIDPTATLEDTILWEDVSVGASARLESCILTDGVSVPAGSVHRRAILIAAPGGGVRVLPL